MSMLLIEGYSCTYFLDSRVRFQNQCSLVTPVMLFQEMLYVNELLYLHVDNTSYKIKTYTKTTFPLKFKYFLTYNVSVLSQYVCKIYDIVVVSSVSTAARALTTLNHCCVVLRTPYNTISKVVYLRRVTMRNISNKETKCKMYISQHLIGPNTFSSEIQNQTTQNNTKYWSYHLHYKHFSTILMQIKGLCSPKILFGPPQTKVVLVTPTPPPLKVGINTIGFFWPTNLSKLHKQIFQQKCEEYL